MHLDFEVFKKHPYASGTAVIIGGLLFFYILTRGSSSGVSSTGSQIDPALLSAETQLAGINSAASVQQSASQAQVTQAQIAAGVANRQTDASIQANTENTAAALAATLAQVNAQVHENDSNNSTSVQLAANNLIAEENIYGMQEAVLADQINAGVVENANNNATAIAGLQIETAAATTLAQQQEADFQKNVVTLAPIFGKKYNSALDANNAQSDILTVLSGGNPSVAEAGVGSSTSAVSSGNSASAAKVGSVVSGLTSVLKGLLG